MFDDDVRDEGAEDTDMTAGGEEELEDEMEDEEQDGEEEEPL